MRAAVVASLALAVGCGGAGSGIDAAPMQFVLCLAAHPDGGACDVGPTGAFEGCHWDRSCGHYMNCACDHGTYRCEVSNVHTGDACGQGDVRCQSGCDQADSSQDCTCVNGTWQCEEGCASGCPHELPGGACDLDPSIGCAYEQLLVACSCVDGTWECEG